VSLLSPCEDVTEKERDLAMLCFFTNHPSPESNRPADRPKETREVGEDEKEAISRMIYTIALLTSHTDDV
jgi:hypothetical protein